MKLYLVLVLLVCCRCNRSWGQVEITSLSYLNENSSLKGELRYFTFDTSGYFVAVYESDSFQVIRPKEETLSFATYDEIREKDDFVQLFTNTSGQYYKLKNSTALLGPYKGELDFILNRTSTKLAFTTKNNGLISLYLGDSLVSKVKGRKLEYNFGYGNWCALSDTGLAIYYIYADHKYRLFINHTQIDSSDRAFKNIGVNDYGDYSYIRFDKKGVYLKTRDTILGPFDSFAYDRIIYYRSIQNDGSYYYEMPGEKRDRWVINNRVINVCPDYLTLTKNGHYMYFYKDDIVSGARQPLDMKNFDLAIMGVPIRGKNEIAIVNNLYKLNIDGKICQLPYNKIEEPVLDTMGNYAFCGVREFYMYRIVNGMERPKPLSKYGIRPRIVKMDAHGSTYHVFNTDDSAYLYHDKILVHAASDEEGCVSFLKQKFQCHPEAIMLSAQGVEYRGGIFNEGNIRKTESWFETEHDYGYFTESEADKASRLTQQQHRRRIVKCGVLNNHTYYIMARKGGGYAIYVDFSLIAVLKGDEIDGIDGVVSNQVYLDSKHLIFYSKRQGRICRYKITL